MPTWAKRKRPARHKPGAPSQVDWSNTFANKLHLFYPWFALSNEDYGPLKNYITNYESATNQSIVGGPHGLELKTDLQALTLDHTSTNLGTKYTLAMQCMPEQLAFAPWSVESITSNYMFYLDATYIYHRADGAWKRYAHGTSYLNVYFTIIIVRDGATVKTYIDGELKNTESAFTSTSELTLDRFNRTGQGRIVYAAAWKDRNFSDAEAKEFTHQPWQIVKTRSSEIFIPAGAPASFQPAWAANATQIQTLQGMS